MKCAKEHNRLYKHWRVSRRLVTTGNSLAIRIVQEFDHLSRASFADLVSMSSSIVWSIQLPDHSESGLFDTPTKPRQRSYQLLADNHMFVICVILVQLTQIPFLCSAFEFGDDSKALYRIVVLLDPLSEAAQKWPSLVKVGIWISVQFPANSICSYSGCRLFLMSTSSSI
jgi:hypothetical protein